MSRTVISVLTCVLCFGCCHNSSAPTNTTPHRILRRPAVIVHDGSAHDIRNLDYGIPGEADVVLNRLGFATGYSTTKNQPIWVSYRLLGINVLSPVAKRVPFRPDPLLSKSPLPSDYTHSGFDRGHIAPAADMAWSHVSMKNSFYMSNMSPQVGMFNRGIWRILEEWVRQKAVEKGSLIVLSGPIFSTNGVCQIIGQTRNIEVPVGYWKVLMDESTREMIGFILENKMYESYDILPYVRSVDEVENETGLDFFSNLSNDVQAVSEAVVSTNLWFRLPTE